MDSQYRNLPQENRQYLLTLIDRIKSETKLLSATLTPTEKTRRSFKDKIKFSLLYGIEEIKTHLNDESYWANIISENKDKIKNIMTNQQEQTQFCENLSIQIEMMIYLESKEKVTEAYKKKLYELCVNMLDNKNEILRKKVIFGIITYEQLVKMSAEELVNPEKQQKLREQKNKFFKEQMFLTEETKVINHKEVSSNTLVGDECKEELNTNSYDMLNYSHSHLKNKKESGINKEKKDENKNENKNLIHKEKSKLSGLSSEMLNFYFDIDEFRKETIVKKIHEKINGNLKEATVNEIEQKRKKFNVNLNL